MKAKHPAYQEILSIGEDAIPLILRDLKRSQARWFDALGLLAEEDPVPKESRGNLQEMISAWLRWGRERGYDV